MTHTYIIAEAGVNHNGDLDLALKMIDAAKDAGVDAVKFQTFKTSKEISKHAYKAEYQKQGTGDHETFFEMATRLELSDENHITLLNYCKSKDIEFLSSPFDIESVYFLHSLGLSEIKISSGQVNNLPLLRVIGALNKKIYLSTGMSEMKEIRNALEILESSGTLRSKIIVLHCNTAYPTPMLDVNLRAMRTLQSELSLDVGYSDHTLGIEVPIAAVALGAKVIEKHFTLDRNMDGPDHKASLEPKELCGMVKAIRNIELALGNPIKRPSPSELQNINVARRSIVASCSIKKGDFFTLENVTVKSPAGGLSPMSWDDVLGRQAPKNFEEDDFIEL